jgi:hypothetical protein
MTMIAEDPSAIYGILEIVDWRQKLLDAARRPGKGYDAEYLQLVATADSSVLVSNEGRRLGLEDEWMIEVDPFNRGNWADAEAFGRAVLMAAKWTRILNASAAISVPGTWNANRHLRGAGADVYACHDGEDWRIRPLPPGDEAPGPNWFLGRFVEIAREQIGSTAYTVLVSVDTEADS